MTQLQLGFGIVNDGLDNIWTGMKGIQGLIWNKTMSMFAMAPTTEEDNGDSSSHQSSAHNSSDESEKEEVHASDGE